MIGFEDDEEGVEEETREFDNKGFEHKMIIQIEHKKSHRTELILASAGMRRKDFYVFAVDVYLVGLYVSPMNLFHMQHCIRNDTINNMCDVLLDKEDDSDHQNETKQPHISVVLKFVRACTKDEVVTAFVTTFADLPSDDVQLFRSELDSRLSDDGVNIGEEVVFYWLEGGGLVITQNQAFHSNCSPYTSKSIEKRLLEVYLHPDRTVAVELVNQMVEFTCDVKL